MARRVQRKRSRGWRMPEGAVYVGRPTKWGNPIVIGGYFAINHMGMTWVQAAPGYQTPAFTLIETREQAVAMYRQLVSKHPPKDLAALRGKDLACWCPLDQPCHADVLLELANEGT